MKKLFLAAAILGMSSFAFGQQQTASKDSKDSKASTQSCTGKCCKKGACTKGDKKTTSATSTTKGTETK